MSTNPILNYISSIVIYRNTPIILQNYETRCVVKDGGFVSLSQISHGINIDPVENNFEYFKLTAILLNNRIRDINNDYKDVSPLYFYFVEKNFGGGVNMRNARYATFYHIACLVDNTTYFLIYHKENNGLRIATRDYIESKNIIDYSLWSFLPFIPETDRQGFNLECIYVDPSVNTECNTKLDIEYCQGSRKDLNMNISSFNESMEENSKYKKQLFYTEPLYIIMPMILVIFLVILLILLRSNYKRKN